MRSAARCSMLQHTIVYYGVLWCTMVDYGVLWCTMVYYAVLWCSVLSSPEGEADDGGAALGFFRLGSRVAVVP